MLSYLDLDTYLGTLHIDIVIAIIYKSIHLCSTFHSRGHPHLLRIPDPQQWQHAVIPVSQLKEKWKDTVPMVWSRFSFWIFFFFFVQACPEHTQSGKPCLTHPIAGSVVRVFFFSRLMFTDYHHTLNFRSAVYCIGTWRRIGQNNSRLY